MARSEEHQKRIDQINQWVQGFKDGDVEAGNKLIMQFDPFLKKQCNRWGEIYKGVYPWEHQMQEAQVLFYTLLNEYTIGGPAYFNVFIERKLPLRLRYFYIKEIKRRQRDLSHSDEQFQLLDADDADIIGYHDDIEDLLKDMDADDRLKDIYTALDSGVLSERERDMLIRNIINKQSHESIAKDYGISRSRVSRIIKKAVEALQMEVKFR